MQPPIPQKALTFRRTVDECKPLPIGTMLFAGPTGVGKTELAKTLAKNYFGSADDMAGWHFLLFGFSFTRNGGGV